MREIPKVPGLRVMCPEDCRYRNKLAPFCGYCLPEIMKQLGIRQKKKEGTDGGEEKRDRQTENQSIGEA